MSQYPEHEKLAAVKDKSQVIGEFLDNGLPDGVVFAEWNRRGDMLNPVRCDIQAWLADYFGIDRDKLEAEKQQMLDEIRASQKEA